MLNSHKPSNILAANNHAVTRLKNIRTNTQPIEAGSQATSGREFICSLRLSFLDNASFPQRQIGHFVPTMTSMTRFEHPSVILIQSDFSSQRHSRCRCGPATSPDWVRGAAQRRSYSPSLSRRSISVQLCRKVNRFPAPDFTPRACLNGIIFIFPI